MNKLFILTLCLVGFAAASRNLKADSMITGGWSCSKDLLTDSRVLDLTDFVFTAVQEYGYNVTNGIVDSCDDGAVTLTQACSQVVAGTKYKLTMDVTCPGANNAISVVAALFVPLPFTNQSEEIDSLVIMGHEVLQADD